MGRMHVQRVPLERQLRFRLDGAERRLAVAEDDEAEALRAARLPVEHHVGGHNATEFAEVLAQLLVADTPRQITDKEFLEASGAGG